MWFLRLFGWVCRAMSWLFFILGLLCLGIAVMKYSEYTTETRRWVEADQIYNMPVADPSGIIPLLMVWSVVLLAVATGLLLLRWGLGKMEGVYARGSRIYRRASDGGMSHFRGRLRRRTTAANSVA